MGKLNFGQKGLSYECDKVEMKVGAPICPRCQQRVYFNEEKKAAGKTWHTRCFTCEKCNKSLDSTNYSQHGVNQILCSSCYRKFCGPNVYGFISGAVLPTVRDFPNNNRTDGLNSPVASISRSSKNSLSSSTNGLSSSTLSVENGNFSKYSPSGNSIGGNSMGHSLSVEYLGVTAGEFCQLCGKRVFFAEEVKVHKKKYHKTCFKCSNCRKFLEMGRFSHHDDDLYCLPCYAKFFGPRGYGNVSVFSPDPESITCRKPVAIDNDDTEKDTKLYSHSKSDHLYNRAGISEVFEADYKDNFSALSLKENDKINKLDCLIIENGSGIGKSSDKNTEYSFYNTYGGSGENGLNKVSNKYEERRFNKYIKNKQDDKLFGSENGLNEIKDTNKITLFGYKEINKPLYGNSGSNESSKLQLKSRRDEASNSLYKNDGKKEIGISPYSTNMNYKSLLYGYNDEISKSPIDKESIFTNKSSSYRNDGINKPTHGNHQKDRQNKLQVDNGLTKPTERYYDYDIRQNKETKYASNNNSTNAGCGHLFEYFNEQDNKYRLSNEGVYSAGPNINGSVSSPNDSSNIKTQFRHSSYNDLSK